MSNNCSIEKPRSNSVCDDGKSEFSNDKDDI